MKRAMAIKPDDKLRRDACRYFGYRPQSEAELKKKLGRKGIPPAEIENTLAGLKAEGLLDDAGFARFWKENREFFAPRSRRLVRQELKRKGVSEDIIEQITGEMNDDENAYRAALDKARRLASGGDDRLFVERLGGYLKRRGFDDEVIQNAMARIRKDTGGTNGLSSGSLKKVPNGGEQCN